MDRYRQFLHEANDTGLARSEIQVVQQSVLRRLRESDVEQFFSTENFRAFYMVNDDLKASEAVRTKVERLIKDNLFQEAWSEVRTAVKNIETGQHQERSLGFLTRLVVQTLRKMGQITQGQSVLREIETLATKVLADRGDRAVKAYVALFWLSLGEGFLDIGELDHGTEILEKAIEMIPASVLTWLDQLDVTAQVLSTIESAPLPNRVEPISQVLGLMHIVSPRPGDSEHYRPIKIRLLDHCLEVALSKEKFSLIRYRNYFDDDEFHVRDRILHERIAGR
jgi:hypothetical protein